MVIMKGRKHLTKAEIEERKNAEVSAPCDKVKPPAFLTPGQKKNFRKLSKDLLEIGLMANVDCDALARLIVSQEQYIEVTKEIQEMPLMYEIPAYKNIKDPNTGKTEQTQVGMKKIVNEEREKLMVIQDRCLKQCRQGAADFGMTVSSRCRLVVPKKNDTKPENKFKKYAGG